MYSFISTHVYMYVDFLTCQVTNAFKKWRRFDHARKQLLIA
jgi:hypothetical protein